MIITPLPRLTHPLLPCTKQNTINLSILPVCNSLLSFLSQKYASFIVALLEIDWFLPVVHRCFFIFTDALSLTSGRGLRFCARARTRKARGSWPLTFNIIMLSPPMHNISKLNFVIFQSCTLYFFNFAFLQTCSLPTLHSYKPLFLTTQTRSAKIQ